MTRRIGARALTAEAEIELAKDLEAGVAAEYLLGASAGWAPDAGRHELGALVAAGERALELLYGSGLAMVDAEVCRYRRPGLAADDLRQEGALGLLQAIWRFDHTRGYRLSTFAEDWVRNAVARAVQRESSGGRLSARRAVEIRQVQASVSATLVRCGEALPAVVAAELGRSIDWVEDRWQPIAWTDADIHQLADRLPAASEPSTLEQEWPVWLAELPEVDAEVLRCRYGLDRGITRTYDWLAGRLGYSEATVRRIERRALASVKEVVQGLRQCA